MHRSSFETNNAIRYCCPTFNQNYNTYKFQQKRKHEIWESPSVGSWVVPSGLWDWCFRFANARKMLHFFPHEPRLCVSWSSHNERPMCHHVHSSIQPFNGSSRLLRNVYKFVPITRRHIRDDCCSFFMVIREDAWKDWGIPRSPRTGTYKPKNWLRTGTANSLVLLEKVLQ